MDPSSTNTIASYVSAIVLREEANFLGLFPLSTHRQVDANGIKLSTFQYSNIISALAIIFFRTTVRLSSSSQNNNNNNNDKENTNNNTNNQEPILLRWFFSIVLGILTYKNKSYELIIAVELFSYVVSWVWQQQQNNNNNESINNKKNNKNNDNQSSSISNSFTSPIITSIFYIGFGGLASFIMAHMITSGQFYAVIQYIAPSIIKQLFMYLFPIQEIISAYNIMQHFVYTKHDLDNMIHTLFFITFHIQCGMGYLGIDFLRQEQSRKNQLIRMDIDTKTSDDADYDNTNTNTNENNKHDDTTTTETKNDTEKSDLIKNGTNYCNNGKPTTNEKEEAEKKMKQQQQQLEKDEQKKKKLLERSSKFQKAAGPFILWVAVPYMIQIIIFGNMNQFAFTCFQDEMHRLVRVVQVFQHDEHLIAMSNNDNSSLAPSAYANSMSTVVSTVYDLFNRKLFSLPKLFLLPTVIARQPILLIQVFPFIFLSDYIKASFVSFMTTEYENLQKEIKELVNVRNKIETFDLKNVELVQRSSKSSQHVRQFMNHRWETLTTNIQSRIVVADIVKRSKEFFAFLQRNFAFLIIIDCALAKLIAIGKIMTSEVFVFSRAIEDAVDLILMRSRSEAELARMITEIDKLHELNTLWEQSTDTTRRTTTAGSSNSSTGSSSSLSNKLHCRIQSPHPQEEHHQATVHHVTHKALVIRNLHYTRGTASARVDHLELYPGVYALTGANGSGKSTLFRIVMSCNTNDKVTGLPPSINLLTPSEPLTEAEDLLREQACLEDDEEDELESGSNNESCEPSPTETSPKSVAVPSEMPHHIPKLSIVMPSSHVVEISQNFYWPLYSKPIDWIFEEHISTSYNESALEKVTRKVAEELHSLQFFQQAQAVRSNNNNIQEVTINAGDNNNETLDGTSDAISAEATIQKIMSELLDSKEDWFTELSGGQKSKVELVRTVFIHEHCPDVLLIDETMAPLDPASKELVMAKLKLFCNDSIIIVIYHTDVGQGKEVEGKTVDCVPSNNFFDKNIHLEKGIVNQRDTC